jgi:hemolysin activation/secretion protein
VPIEYTTVAASYQASLIGERATTNGTLGVVAGLRPLSDSSAVFSNNRGNTQANTQPDFFTVRVAADRVQELPYGLQAAARAQALASPDLLIANEQFSLGGLDTVRGYKESEVLGDYGGSLQLELRSPQLADRLGGGPINNLRLHAFYDAGAVAIYQPLPQQRGHSVLSSAGAGVRVRLYDHLNGEVQDAVTFNPGQITRGGSDHILFRFFGDF